MEKIFGRPVAKRQEHAGHMICARGVWKPLWVWLIDVIASITLIVVAIAISVYSYEYSEEMAERLLFGVVTVILACGGTAIYLKEV